METNKYTLTDVQTIFDAICVDLDSDPCWQEELDLRLPDRGYECSQIIKEYAESRKLTCRFTIDDIYRDFRKACLTDLKTWMWAENIPDSIFNYFGDGHSFRLTELYAPKPYLYSNIFREIEPSVFSIDATSDGKLYLTECVEQNFLKVSNEAQDDIDWLVTHLWEDFLKYIEPVRELYVYIVDSKNNELEIFKEWLVIYEEFYFAPQSVSYSEFPFKEVLSFIENIENNKDYSCNDRQSKIKYSKLLKVKSLLEEGGE